MVQVSWKLKASLNILAKCIFIVTFNISGNTTSLFSYWLVVHGNYVTTMQKSPFENDAGPTDHYDFKYRGYLLRQNWSFVSHVVLLKVEREMWKSVDFGKIHGFWCRFYGIMDFAEFQKKLMFPPWILTVEGKLIVSFTSFMLISAKSASKSAKSMDFMDFAIMRFRPLIK